jgi:hypothetical protein
VGKSHSRKSWSIYGVNGVAVEKNSLTLLPNIVFDEITNNYSLRPILNDLFLT